MRYARAGAFAVISVAAGELATIKKVETTKYDLEEIVRNCKEGITMKTCLECRLPIYFDS